MTNTKVTFEISARDKTELHFTHEGLVPGNEYDGKGDFNQR